MAIALAVLLEIALIAAGGRDDLVAQGDGGKVAAGALGIADADLPVGAVRLGSDSRDSAAEVEDRGLDLVFGEDLLCPVGGVALGDSAEVELHLLGNIRPVEIERDLRVIDVLQQLVDRRLVGDTEIAADEAPFLDQRINRGVKRTVRALTDLESAFEHLENVLVLDKAGLIQLADLAVRVVGVKERFQPQYFILNRFGGFFVAVKRDLHEGVHALKADRFRIDRTAGEEKDGYEKKG